MQRLTSSPWRSGTWRLLNGTDGRELEIRLPSMSERRMSLAARRPFEWPLKPFEQGFLMIYGQFMANSWLIVVLSSDLRSSTAT